MLRLLSPLCIMSRKFREGDKHTVLETLRRERSRNPGQVVYCLALKTDTPGTGYILHIRPTVNATPHHEYFLVSPHGVYFRGKVGPQDAMFICMCMCVCWRACTDLHMLMHVYASLLAHIWPCMYALGHLLCICVRCIRAAHGRAPALS